MSSTKNNHGLIKIMPNIKIPTLLPDIKLNISHDDSLPNYYSHMACTQFALKWTESLKKNGAQAPCGNKGSQWFEPTSLYILSTINTPATTAQQTSPVRVWVGKGDMGHGQRWKTPRNVAVCVRKIEVRREEAEGGRVGMWTDNKRHLSCGDKLVCKWSFRSNQARVTCY